MRFPTRLIPIMLLLSCHTEDKRLPQKLMEEARSLSNVGKTMEAKYMLERIIQKFPNTPEGKQANQDLFIIQSSLKIELKEKKRLLQGSMIRIINALKRYKTKEGEYPWTLQQLLPEYLDVMPESPWGHPPFYRPFVTNPIQDIVDRRGNVTQKFNFKLDAYHMASLGTDLRPGGTDLAKDILVVSGSFIEAEELPKIPEQQPLK